MIFHERFSNFIHIATSEKKVRVKMVNKNLKNVIFKVYLTQSIEKWTLDGGREKR